MKTQLIIFLIFLTTLTSCQDKKIIVVSGKITEELSGKPIPRAEVVVLCWYMNSIDEASFIKQTITADELGNYETIFTKGHQVDVASKAKGFIANRSYNKLKNNIIQVNLKLSIAKQNPWLRKNLSIDHATFDVTDKTPFLRIRFYSIDTSKVLDVSRVETFGYDLSSQKTTTDISNCDIWFNPINKDEPPTTIIANKGGGILPVYANEINSSFLYEKATAPTTGYLNEYQLKGNEEGFFVLCRDGKTYGKIILEKSEIDTSRPDGKGGFYKEFGKHFSCLYQPNGTTNLSYSTPDMDLEDYLVDYRLR